MLPEDGDWVVPVEGEAPAVEPQQPDLFGQHPAQQQPQQPPQGDWVQPHEVGFWESLGNSAERGARSFYRNWQGLPGQLQGQAMAEDIQRRIAAGEDSVWTRRFIDNPELLETLRQQYAENAAQALPIVAEQNRRIQELPQHPAAEAMQRAQTWGEAWDHFTSAPLQVIANIGLESLVQQAPSLAAGAVAGGVGGLPALMATIGLGSAHTEYMGGIFSALSEEGVDITNPEALRAALLDQELMGRVRHRSAVKAGVVGLFDAGSAGLASRVLLPAATFATRPVARHLTNVGVQVPAQGAMGGAGEALGSVASGQDVSPGAVMGEIVGEAFGAPAEVAAARHARRPVLPTPPVGDWVVPAEPAVEPAAPTPLPSSGPQAAITGFYSPAERAVTDLPRKQGPAQAWFNDLKKRGVSDDELDWMGFSQWMEENKGRPISREEMAEFVRENGADLVEVRQDNSPLTESETRRADEAALDRYFAPFSEIHPNYQNRILADIRPRPQFASNFPAGTTNPRNFLVRLPGLNYESPHFGGPTVSFIRVADTVGPNGEKTLLVHGNQSELHQEAEKQGYSDEVSPNPRGWETTDGRPAFVPNAPLKGDRWWQLGLKLALRQAVAEGYDAVAISTADQVKATDGNAPTSLYDKKMPTWLGKYVRPMGGEVASAPVPSTRGKTFDSLEEALSVFPRGSITQGISPVGWTVHAPGRRTIFGRAAGDKIGVISKAFNRFHVIANDSEIMQSLRIPDSRPTVLITPKMRESISKGQPLFAAHNSPTSEDAQTRALNAVNDGETADIPIKVADGILNDIRSGEASRYLRMVPSEYEVGSLVMLEPAGENVRAVFLTTNDTYTSMLLPRNAIDSLGALHVSPGYTDSGVGGLFFLRFDLPGEFGKRLAGELRHEAGHALRSSGKLSGQVWQRLLGHARSLSSMGMSVRDYLFAKRDAYWQGAPETTTVNEAYTRIYSGRPDFQEVMDQEHVMIMLELHHHGYFSDADVAPVMDIIRDMEAGVYSGHGTPSVATGPSMAIAGERAPKIATPADLGFNVRPYAQIAAEDQVIQQTLDTVDAMLPPDMRHDIRRNNYNIETTLRLLGMDLDLARVMTGREDQVRAIQEKIDLFSSPQMRAALERAREARKRERVLDREGEVSSLAETLALAASSPRPGPTLPMTVYHGTNREFRAFSPTVARSIDGSAARDLNADVVFVTGNRRFAETFGPVKRLRLDSVRLFDPLDSWHLAQVAPYINTLEGAPQFWRRVAASGIPDNLWSAIETPEMVRELQRLGYDGAVMTERIPGDDKGANTTTMAIWTPGKLTYDDGEGGPMFAISGGPHIPTALSFIREHGGIKDENGELKAILDRPGRGSKGYLVGIVNNKTGVPLDRMRELMVEAGYIQRTPDNRPDETSIQDVLDIIRRIKDGEKVAPLGFEIELLNERDSAIASENRDQILREAEVILATHGMPYDLSETEEARLVELVEGGMAVDDALEQATIETINGRDESEAAAADSRGVAEDGGQAPEGEFGADRAGIESAPDDRAREARAEGGLPTAVTPPPVPVVPPPLPVRTAVPPPVPPGSKGGTGGRGGPPPGDIIPPAPPSGPPGPLPAPNIIDADVRRSMRDRVNSFARAMNTWWNPMNGLPELEQYRIGRYKMLGRIDHGERMTEMIWKDFKGASKADKKAAYTFLTTRGTTSGAISDPKVRQAAEATKHLFNGLGTAAVERGLIPQEAFDKYRDQYLPRLYLKHILSQGSVLGFAGNARPSDLGWTKNRKDIDKETRILMGEVMDPGFLAARGVFRMHRDMSIIDFLDHIAGNDQWVFRDTLVNFNGRLASPYYLRSEATALRERARYEPNETYKNAMKLMAEDMDAVASPLIRKDENVPDGYVQIPDSKRYGMLRGMYVRKEIRDDLLPTMTLLPADVSTIEAWFSPGGAMTRVNSLWKAMKVPLNPATQVRNVMSNAIMMYLSGMSPLRVQRAWSDAGKEIASNGPLYKKALDMGLKASGFSEQEVIRLTKEWAQVEKVEAEQSAWGPLKLAFLFAKHQGAGVVTWAGDKYQYFEGRMKLAMMMDAVKNEGMTPEQGFLKAQDWLFDYSDVHKAVRYARNAPIGMPFVCVDDTTEMLTQRGWVSAYDAKIGDMAASMDLSTGTLSWHPVEDIFLSPYDGDMVHVRDRHLDMMMTPDHRVVTYKRRKDGTYHLGVTTAQELVCADHIPVAAEFDHTPVGEPIPDAVVEVIGWYVTEGTPHPNCQQIVIYQNAGPKADRIRDALRRAGFTFGEADQKPNYAGNVLKVFSVHAEFGARVREMCPGKQLTPELVMRLSKSQIRLLVDTMIDGDGSRSDPERPTFIQKNNQTASSFMMALTILGESYGVSQRSDGIDMLSITLRNAKRYCVKRATNDRVNYTGNIWCPKVTGTATWVARRNGKVFITHNTYYYKALPKLLEVAATRPLRFLPFVALPYVMAQAFAHMWDVDDDDVEKLRQSLPEYMRKKSSAFILPWRDEHGRWQFFDFGYLLPWSMFWETGQAIASGNITGIVKESGILGGPILDVISAIKTGGVDPFTQRPIFDKRDPPEKRAWDIASYVWRLAMPPWITDQSFLLKMRDAYAGTPDRYGEPGLTMGQAALRGVGLNVNPVDPEATQARNISQMRREIRDTEIRMRSQLRNQSLSDAQREALAEQYRNHIAELRRRMSEYSANSEINPRLRRGAPPAASPVDPGDWVRPVE